MIALNLARYRFTVKLLQPLLLKEYSGSMLRGVFGHGLHRLNCLARAENCSGCTLVNSCNYARIFQPETVPSLKGRYSEVPPPYIIEAADTVSGELHEGETFSFCLVLFGNAVNQLSSIIFAFQQGFQIGLGDNGAQAKVIRVEWQQAPTRWTEVYSEQELAVRPHTPNEPLPTVAAELHRLTLELVTPTRIQHFGKICTVKTLDAHGFLSSLQRKISLYSELYLDSVHRSLPDVLSGNDDILLTSEIKTKYWHRYSNRQKRYIQQNGQVGEITLTGELTNWLPWLWLGLWTHVGKNTSFGLGQYRFKNN